MTALFEILQRGGLNTNVGEIYGPLAGLLATDFTFALKCVQLDQLVAVLRHTGSEPCLPSDTAVSPGGELTGSSTG